MAWDNCARVRATCCGLLPLARHMANAAIQIADCCNSVTVVAESDINGERGLIWLSCVVVNETFSPDRGCRSRACRTSDGCDCGCCLGRSSHSHRRRIALAAKGLRSSTTQPRNRSPARESCRAPAAMYSIPTRILSRLRRFASVLEQLAIPR